MTTHELKLDIKYFDDVKSGKKNFEIRKNDRDYQVGDVLKLKAFTNGWYVTHVLPDGVTLWEMTENAEEADTIRARVTWIVDSFENTSKSGADFAFETDKAGISLEEQFDLIKKIDRILHDYFHTDTLPDDYVVLGVEVLK